MQIKLLRTFKVKDVETGEDVLLLKGTVLTDEITDIHPEIMLEVTEPRPDAKTVEVLDPRPSKRAASEEKGEETSPASGEKSEKDSTADAQAASGEAKTAKPKKKAAVPTKKNK